MFKTLIFTLLFLLLALGWQFYMGESSWLKVQEINKEIAKQQQELTIAQKRNYNISLEIERLKNSPVSSEEEARYALGMIKNKETYCQVVEPVN